MAQAVCGMGRRKHAGHLRAGDAQILDQHASGTRGDLAHRIARRDAHSADAARSGLLTDMPHEPDRAPAGREAMRRLLVDAHTMPGAAVVGDAPAIRLKGAGWWPRPTRPPMRWTDARSRHAMSQPLVRATADGDDTTHPVLAQLALVMVRHGRLREHAQALRSA